MTDDKCIIWIDRHVHKNAGTSIRQAMVKLQEADLVQHLPTMAPDTKELTALAKALLAFEQPNCSLPLRRTRIAIEAHLSQTEFFTSMKALRVLRQPSSCCRLLITSRVRKPLDHYISVCATHVPNPAPFYMRIGVVSRRVRAPPHPPNVTLSHAQAWLWAGEPLFGRFNRTLETWAPHNMQATMLLKGDLRGWMDGAKRWNTRPSFRFNQTEAELLDKSLSADVDLVYPSDRYEEGECGGACMSYAPTSHSLIHPPSQLARANPLYFDMCVAPEDGTTALLPPACVADGALRAPPHTAQLLTV